METVDYLKRSDMVEALVDARKRGVEVEVVGNGRTLKFPNGLEGVGATEEDLAALEQEEKDLAALAQGTETLPPADDTEKTAEADGVEKTPVEGDSLVGVVQPEEPLDRSTFTVEGTCSGCGEAAIAEPDGSWIHVEPATHGDTDGEFVPNEPADEDEDLIGAPTSSPKRKRNRSN